MSSAKTRRRPPLVYSCSGCSSAAQMANQIAVSLDREGVAEMSCIAGVGGGVRSLVRVAKAGRPIIALDGCVLACVTACLAQHDIKPSLHFILTDFGVQKKTHENFDADQAAFVREQVMMAVTESGLLNQEAFATDGNTSASDGVSIDE